MRKICTEYDFTLYSVYSPGGKYLHISVGTVPQSVLPATSARSERSERKYCSIQASSVMQFFWVDGCTLNDTIMYRRR